MYTVCVIMLRTGVHFAATGHSRYYYTSISLTDFKRGSCRTTTTLNVLRVLYWEICFLNLLETLKILWWILNGVTLIRAWRRGGGKVTYMYLAWSLSETFNIAVSPVSTFQPLHGDYRASLAYTRICLSLQIHAALWLHQSEELAIMSAWSWSG